MKKFLFLFTTLLMPLFCRAAEDSVAVKRVTEGIAMLDKIYFSPTLHIWLDRPRDDLRAHWEGRINPPWWSAANAVEMLADFMNQTKSNSYDKQLAAMHELHRDAVKRWPLVKQELVRRQQWKPEDDATLRNRMQRGSHFTDFRNEYMDDSGWWGVAWLAMAQRTGDARYLHTAQAIQAHLANHWRPDLGGGVIWCTEPNKQTPNSITNNLFLILSARLAAKTKDVKCREWAVKAYDWLHAQKLYDGIGVVDGPGHQRDYWSYNQGTYLGGLVAYAEATGKQEALTEAASVAETVLTKAGFTNADGVIVEALGTSGWDGALFKGILARYLRQTSDALKRNSVELEAAKKIDRILAATTASILKHAVAADGQFLGDWNAEPKNRDVNYNTDLSALIALVAGLR